VFDSVRGVSAGTQSQISTNLTAAVPSSTNGNIKSFDSDGFSVEDGTSGGAPRSATNLSGTNYVSWNWKAGGTGVSNTDGTITSTVSANPTAGFSIVKYTGNATAGATVGHGLSQAPELTILRNYTVIHDWQTYAEPIGNTKYLSINSTSGESTSSTRWNNTTPSASVITLGNSNPVNENTKDIIIYCFHSVEGYSKIGSFVGNGLASGTFIYTGFRPAWVVIKKSSASGDDWYQFDSKREPYNFVDKRLVPNGTQTEGSGNPIDFLSNGIKIRDSSSSFNGSNTTMIYMAFAESPFKTSNAR